jgi:hypothetical protein
MPRIDRLDIDLLGRLFLTNAPVLAIPDTLLEFP